MCMQIHLHVYKVPLVQSNPFRKGIFTPYKECSNVGKRHTQGPEGHTRVEKMIGAILFIESPQATQTPFPLTPSNEGGLCGKGNL
jgi:hypothetical protein